MLHVKGYADGSFCFMIDDTAVSVHEALLQNGKPYHKATINALNIKNLPSENDLILFERIAKVLHTGVDAFNARIILRQHFNIDVLKREFNNLSSSEIYDLGQVYNICKYKVTVKEPLHSTMYYFFMYLSKKDIQPCELI